MSHIDGPVFLARRASLDSTTSLTTNLLGVLLTLVLVSLLLVSILVIFRRRRRTRKEAAHTLPTHKLETDLVQIPLPLEPPPVPTRSRHRRTPSTLSLSISASGPHPPAVFVYQEKEDICRSSPNPPSSPLPEIRITFPDEIDDKGRRQSGRVMVVHIGEYGEGLAPLDEELPLYQHEVTERFQDVHLDSLGGLREG